MCVCPLNFVKTRMPCEILTSAVKIHSGPLSIELTSCVDGTLRQCVSVTGIGPDASFQSNTRRHRGSSYKWGCTTISCHKTKLYTVNTHRQNCINMELMLNWLKFQRKLISNGMLNKLLTSAIYVCGGPQSVILADDFVWPGFLDRSCVTCICSGVSF